MKARNAAAVSGENSVSSAAGSSAVPVSRRTAIVETTASLAVKPVTSAVTTRQSPKPSGLNIGATMRAMSASRLSDESSTTLSLVSNVRRNQMTTVAMKMMEKARRRKSLTLSQRSRPVVLRLGKR